MRTLPGQMALFVWVHLFLLHFAIMASADEFRIETRIFVGDLPEPVSTNVTLFRGSVVYDFLTDPDQIAVFRKLPEEATGRFILLDPIREVRTELTTDRITQIMTGLKAWSLSQSDPLLRFAGEPRFQTQFDEREKTLVLTSDAMTYRLLTNSAKNGEVARQYHEFSDWYARLGSLLHPGSTPPFPRLVVNQALETHQVLPREVQLAIPAAKPYRKHDLLIRSEHRIAHRHSTTDRERIDEANEHLVNFRLVTLDEFRRP